TGDALRACRGQTNSDRLLVLNGDDMYGVADLGRLLTKPAGLLAYPVDEPRKFGILFPKPDGTLHHLEEKPALEGPRLAHIGAYLFPKEVFAIELLLSPRGEYEITDAVNILAGRMAFHIVEAKNWLPIGTVEAWQNAQSMDLREFQNSRKVIPARFND